MGQEDRSGCQPLRLLALDADDLKVISAALQDAIAHVGDIRFEAQARRVTILFNRYRWEGGECEGGSGERVCAALQFGDVSRVRQRGMTSEDPGALVSCMAVDFEPCEAPGGSVLFRFCHGGDLRVEVDCIDAVLADVSEPWPATRAPDHPAEIVPEEV
ncbi:DUF2948 family protein [Caulobacter sp. S45]|uniref:DUF2948 family protein n=1 Tax=Caulobacter sp. S45 TaxID=1641861 RepID=UPI00131C02DF|nr:DUF2948 family protein [Caulobacter sp. S45]